VPSELAAAVDAALSLLSYVSLLEATPSTVVVEIAQSSQVSVLWLYVPSNACALVVVSPSVADELVEDSDAALSEYWALASKVADVASSAAACSEALSDAE